MDLFEDNIFKNDPLYMKNLIGKSVKITTTEETSFEGIVYVIDPIYKTIVLHTKETGPNKHNTVFILHHAIKSLEILSEEVKNGYLEEKMDTHSSSDMVQEKLRLKKWLQNMRINVDEIGDYLKIDDHLIIMPPYGLDNCICNNTIVLEKIRNIIGLMPKEFN
ncbi:unnamed protein product [Ceutorhynchus assimilis]|uniref:AD domain-containing protein n=1 Tax=Ceutorhynchus assimilis TaxID=467358 RepID=A0A9N9QR59_9CUCU|nr:unnamed protein product [Ceutorhynchus assimilis]